MVLLIIPIYLTFSTLPASIDYQFQYPAPSFLGKGFNSITVYCDYGAGEWDGDFSLVLSFVNATFSNQTNANYVKISDTLVRFRFLLHKGGSSSIQVFFTTNENVKGLTITLTLERTNVFDIALKSNLFGSNPLRYKSTQDGNFALNELR